MVYEDLSIDFGRTNFLQNRDMACKLGCGLFLSPQLDCKQSFFSLKIYGEECKTSKHASMTVRVACEQRCRGPEVVCEIAMVLYNILDARHSGGRVIILMSLWSSDTHVSKLYK